MIQIKEIFVKKILNPTQINLGEYVINPYRGCVYGCIYCYVKANKSIVLNKQRWGRFVEIRTNAVKLLREELKTKKPKRVLIGSTTDCFQPLEKKYRLMEKILTILNENAVFYNILTRSPLCLNYLDILKKGYCESIYFTINDYPIEYKRIIEPASPSFLLRFQTIKKISESGIKVIPYISPLLPWLTNLEKIFLMLEGFKYVSFEALNLFHPHIKDLIDNISKENSNISQKYLRMKTYRNYYEKIWKACQKKINDLASIRDLKYQFYIHHFESFYQNKY